MEMDLFLKRYKGVSLLISHMIILYASGKMVYVNIEQMQAGQAIDVFSYIVLFLSTLVFLIFSTSFIYSIKHFPFVQKIVKNKNEKVFFLSATKSIFVTVVAIIYFSIGVLGLLWQLYIWQTIILLFVIFLPFIIEQTMVKFGLIKGEVQ
jgi:hypothetical protein